MLVPLIVGVLVGFYFSTSIQFNTLLYVLASLFIFTIPAVSKMVRLKWVYAVLASFFFFSLGVVLVQINTTVAHDAYFAKELGVPHVYQVKLLEAPIEKERSFKALIEIQTKDEMPCTGNAIAYLAKDSAVQSLQYGDVLLLKGRFNKISTSQNPNAFDYARYMRLHNIYHQIYLKPDQFVKVGADPNRLKKATIRLRNYLEGKLFDANLGTKNTAVAKALMLGDKNMLDYQTQLTFAGAGAMHVLAVSGLHVGIVMLIFSFFLKPLKKMKWGKVLFTIVLITILWIFAAITGFSSSVLRASVMFSFVVIGRELQRETSIYQSIAVSGFLLILIEPLIIFQVGFQLSYSAVLGIVYLQPKLYKMWYVKWKVIDYFWQLTTVSIAAQIATFPLALYYFHQFPNYFLLTNFIIIPLAFAILIVGIAYFLFTWLPILNEVLLFCLSTFLTWLNEGVAWVQRLPNPVYHGVALTWFDTLLIYTLLIGFIVGFVYRRKGYLYAGFLGVILLFSLSLHRKMKLRDSNQLVIYNVNNAVAIDVFYGRKNHFFASSDFLLDDEKMGFYVRENWVYRLGRPSPYEKWEMNSEQNPIIYFGKQACVIISDTNIPRYNAQLEQAEVYYLEGLNFVPQRLLKAVKLTGKHIVLGNNNSYKVMNFIRDQISEHQLHDLRQEGAFVLSF